MKREGDFSLHASVESVQWRKAEQMIIKSIRIQDYRSCLDTEVELHPNLSVLIGPNASGKTTVLNALLLLRHLTAENRYHSPEEAGGAQCKLKVWFELNGKRASLTAAVRTDTDQNNRDVVMSSRQLWYARDFTGTRKRLDIPLFLARHIRRRDLMRLEAPLSAGFTYARYAKVMANSMRPRITPRTLKALATIAEHLSEMQYYGASQFTNPGNCPVSFEIEREGFKRRGFRLGRQAKFLFDLYSEWRSGSAAYQQFFELVGPGGIGLIDKIHFQEIPTSSIEHSVKSGGKVKTRRRDRLLAIPQFTIGNHEVSANQLSEGTFKTITWVFYLVTHKSSIVLLEEPEVCVHHGLLSSIIELIKTYSREKQIILSTHSDFVLDKIAPENVFKVSNSPEHGTQVMHIPKSMSRRELKALKRYLDTEGNLGEYWRHGALE